MYITYCISYRAPLCQTPRLPFLARVPGDPHQHPACAGFAVELPASAHDDGAARIFHECVTIMRYVKEQLPPDRWTELALEMVIWVVQVLLRFSANISEQIHVDVEVFQRSFWTSDFQLALWLHERAAKDRGAMHATASTRTKLHF